MVRVMAGKRGRPNKYDPLEIAKKLDDYIDSNKNPIIAKFCIEPGNPCKDTVYELAKTCEELSYSIKRAVDKQEAYVEEGAMNGTVNPTFAIFKLKQPQHGWTDKQQIDSNISGALEINVNVVED